MKFLKFFFSANLVAVLLIMSSGIHLTSCTKEVAVHDTTTLIVRDTIIITDTVYNLKAGLVAHFNFNSGSLLDASGYNNNIVFNNATATTDRFGASNNAYSFNGSGSYMRVSNSASLNPQRITLMAVVKINDFYMGTCHASEIIGKGSPDNINGYYTLRVRDPYGDCYGPVDVNNEFFVGSYGDDIPQGAASGAASDTSKIQKGQWYNVIYTYDGKESKIYVNGELKGTEQKTVSFTPNSHDLFIGKHEDPQFPYLFNGVIDEIRIYDRALCLGEIKQLNKM